MSTTSSSTFTKHTWLCTTYYLQRLFFNINTSSHFTCIKKYSSIITVSPDSAIRLIKYSCTVWMAAAVELSHWFWKFSICHLANPHSCCYCYYYSYFYYYLMRQHNGLADLISSFQKSCNGAQTMKHCPLLFSPLQQIKDPLPRILWLACSTIYGGLLKS